MYSDGMFDKEVFTPVAAFFHTGCSPFHLKKVKIEVSRGMSPWFELLRQSLFVNITTNMLQLLIEKNYAECMKHFLLK